MAKKPFKKKYSSEKRLQSRQKPQRDADENEPSHKDLKKKKVQADQARAEEKVPSDGIRLNKYLANSGISSRREADQLIADGKVKVNNKVVTEMGYKVMPKDTVYFEGNPISREKLVYVLLNKPKGFLTTSDDPKERKTVMDLVSKACDERIYPVGRLDKNTSGLLLFTNDGDLVKKLTQPGHKLRKIYQVVLNKPIEEKDFIAIEAGLQLEDELAQVEKIAILTPDLTTVGIEIVVGKNRMVRRIFEHLGYSVEKLDRTVFAGLTKKDLPRGKWRILREREVINLKHLK
jgi:23S rRNA pseudouridine2605 synthase